MSLVNSFNYFFGEHQFIKSGKILLAVSGGIDSVVLAKLLKEFTLNFSIVHCNFQLRGKDSDEDEFFVENMATQYEVPFYIKKFDTISYAKERGISTQIAARELRYEWFEKLANKHNFQFIATAHHANDQLETIVFNLTKGTGIKGLRGILPINGNIIRPLIYAKKEEIEQYALEKKLKWRDDISNQSLKYKRNLIRHKVIPVLEKINPSLISNLHFTTERLADTAFLLKNNCEEFLQKYSLKTSNNEVQINLTPLKKSPIKNLILSEILSSYGFNYRQAKQIALNLNGQTGKVYKSIHYELLINRKFLILRPISQLTKLHEVEISENTQEIEFSDVTLKCANIDFSSIKDLVFKPNRLFVDISLISFPLIVRYWQPGDSFMPFGMKGRKKISDFLTDKKLSIFEKQTVKVLCSENIIVWVIGLRPDNRFRVTDKTKKIYSVEVI